MHKTVISDEIELCLEAISKHPKGANEIESRPAEIYCTDGLQERLIYINFVDPSLIDVGQIYRTWVVQIKGGKVDGISYFRSQKGQYGDDTLPPD